MRPTISKISRLILPWAGLFAICATSQAGGPFGFADPSFSAPRFTARCYPDLCVADGRGGLLWSFVNLLPDNFAGANGSRVGGLVRTTTDGVVDDGFVVGAGIDQTMGVAVQADGMILAAGRLVGDLATNGAPNYRIFRFLTNGVMDSTYHSPVFGDTPRFLTVQPDGKVLVALTGLSDSTALNGGIIDFARLNQDGSLDATFQRPIFTSGFMGVYAPPVVETNGAIYVTGGFTQVNGQNRNGVARLLSNGALDPAFVPSGFSFTLYNRGLVVQWDGRVVIAGRLRVGASRTYYPLIRLNSDGSLDNTFNLVPCNVINFDRARRLTTTSDGKLLTLSTSMARFNSDGTLDNTFTRLPFGNSSGDTNSYWECYWFEQLADGRLIITSDPAVGTTKINGQPFNGAVRLQADGTLDPSFSQPAFQHDIFPTTIAFGADGQLLVGGAFDHVGSIAKTGLARLTTAGALDSSYALTQSNVLSVLGLAPLQDNKSYALLESGDVSFGAPSNYVARLQADGSIDPQFNAAPSSVNAAEAFYSDFLMQNGQPVVVGSRAQALLDQTNIPIVRLLADGEKDPGFQPALPMPGSGTFFDGSLITDWSSVTIDDSGELFLGDVQLLTALPNGKLLIAVCPSLSDGSYVYQFLRLNSDGSTDAAFSGPTFSPVSTASYSPVVTDRQGTVGQMPAEYPVRCLTATLVQSNGCTIVSGTFTNVNGTFRPGIARLKTDSSLDLTFPVGVGPATLDGVSPVVISGISADSAGHIWVTGNFGKWDGIVAPGYVRLTQDGTVDTNCLPQSSHYPVNDFVENWFGRALPAGAVVASVFSGVLPSGTNQCYAFGPAFLPGGPWPNALARLVSYPPPMLYSQGLLSGSRFGMAFNSESGQSYWLQASPDLETWTNWLQIQGTGNQMLFTEPVSAALTRKFYRVVYQ